jgi:hypothetical protein
VESGFAEGSVTYRASWMVFDNATGATRPLAETASETTTIVAPSGLPPIGFVAVDIAANSDTHTAWKEPVRVYFSRDGGSWRLVGLERTPDKPATARAGQNVSR